MKFKTNPYVWTMTGETLRTNVLSFELRDENETLLTADNLPEPISVFLPLELAQSRDVTAGGSPSGGGGGDLGYESYDSRRQLIINGGDTGATMI